MNPNCERRKSIKKKIIIGVFSVWIIVTAVYFLMAAIASYRYDMDPKNGVDILEGVGAAIAIVLGGLIVFYELDLFYTVYYFFVKPKTVIRSILNILANVSLLLMLFSDCIAKALAIGEEVNVMIAMFLIYVVLRLVYGAISVRALLQEA